MLKIRLSASVNRWPKKMPEMMKAMHYDADYVRHWNTACRRPLVGDRD
ncbi:MAG: hypothetical protein R3E89_18700 [Thiolinea sp.]